MKGYEKLSLLTSEFPELLILRRFDRLSARILLRLQAELLYLEEELKILIEVDEGDDPDLSHSWEKLRKASNENENIIHLNKYIEVQEKLKMYHETILRVQSIQSMSQPTRQNRSRLWEWLCNREGGDNFLQSGIEAGPWESEKPRELLTLVSKSDSLDVWLSDVLTPMYHRLVGSRQKPDMNHEAGLGRLWIYKLSWLHYLGDLLCVLLSSIVPVASIQGLYWMPSSLVRLNMITALIILFSIILMFVAGCRRSEVFAATSAFAAVLVVFLQGLGGQVNYPAAPVNTNT